MLIKTKWLLWSVLSLLASGVWAADMKAILDTTNGASAFVVSDARTNQKFRVGSDGVIAVSNVVNRGLGLQPMIAIGGGDNVEIGAGANGYHQGAAIGWSASGYYFGAAMGYGAVGEFYSAALGNYASATNHGVAVGANAVGANYSAALGKDAAGENYAVGVGYGASGQDGGAAVGASARAGRQAVALGQSANSANTNVAIGAYANAAGGINRIAIGPSVTNDLNNSARLRGTLYLDGGTGIFYRSTFGAGGWSSLIQANSNFVRKTGDTMTGPLTVNTNITLSYTADRGLGDRSLLTIAGGDDVEIGYEANGYNSGVAVGMSACGYQNGVALGSGARGRVYGAALGSGAKAWEQGVALGYAANGSQTNIAIGYMADTLAGDKRIAIGPSVVNDVDNSARIRGTLYLDGGTSVLCRSTFGGGDWEGLLSAERLNVATGFVRKTGDTMSGALHILSVENRGSGDRAIVTIGGGEDVEVGGSANGYWFGTALGHWADGSDAGAAVGNNAKARSYGVALGNAAKATNSGVAIGAAAMGSQTNIAIGYQADAQGGNKRIAIGPYVDNDIDHSARIRGTLYLDGGTGIFYRSTFGLGDWSKLILGNSNFVSKTGDTMTGALSLRGAVLNIESNRSDLHGVRNMLEIEGGADVEIGMRANGYYYGAAIGWEADAYYSGAAVGYDARGHLNGAALGGAARGIDRGVGVGWSANGSQEGVAIGMQSRGVTGGVAVGIYSEGTYSNVAIGYFARAKDGANRIAIGLNVSNIVDNSACLRGALYLDGGTGIFYRSTFGSGAWSSFMGGYVSKAGDTMSGMLTVNTNLSLGYEANRGFGPRSMLTIGGGSDVEIGAGANGYYHGAAVGYQANGRWVGAAVGYQANGTEGGVAMGYQATGAYSGVAVGQAANGNENGAAVGREANAFTYGAALGYLANGSANGVAIGAGANAAAWSVALGAGITNPIGGSTRVRGSLYLDGGTRIYTNGSAGSPSWGIKAFAIDHPLDPQNKVLRHYCLEGPEVWNVYAGNAQLVNGEAVVELPAYYTALNKAGSEICDLTPWGKAAVWVQGVEKNRLSIMGDADVKVSWSIKVPRNDPACLEDLKNRPVEQLKSELGTGHAAAENMGVNASAGVSQ